MLWKTSRFWQDPGRWGSGCSDRGSIDSMSEIATPGVAWFAGGVPVNEWLLVMWKSGAIADCIA